MFISHNGGCLLTFINMQETRQRIILFDGVCNLCNGLVQFVIRHDKHSAFTFGSLQSGEGQALLREKGLPTDDFDSFVFLKGNKVYLKSTGALHVLKDLGGAWRVLYAFIIIPRPIRDFIYGVIAKNRYSFFGRRESCMLPTPDLQKRFLR